MFENLHRFGCNLDASPCVTAKGGFTVAIYWSSSEFDGNPAFRTWEQGFNGVQLDDNKANVFRVRTIRAF